MIYEKRLTIPKNTVKNTPTEDDLIVHPGVLNQVEVQFPSGCAGLVHVQILYWEHIVFPSNPDADFTGDDTHLVFTEDMTLNDAPFIFTVRGWNDDDTYDHTVIVRMQITEKGKSIREVLNTLFVPAGGMSRKV